MWRLYSREHWQQWAWKEFEIGEKKAWPLLKILRDEGRVRVVEQDRPGTNRLKLYQKKMPDAVCGLPET
jgi:hypothetical protein